MRNFIIGLSILCYALSGIITFEASGIPDRNTRYENNSKELKTKDISPKLKDILGQLANEQTANRVLVEELQATIVMLDNKLSKKNEDIQANVETEGYEEKTKKILGQLANEQATNRALVEELQATIARLDNKLSNKSEEIQANVETEGYEKKTRVLAVLGGAFRSGQVGIGENLMIAVKKLVPDILASPDHRVIIEGHTDNMPIKLSSGKQYKDNMDLSFLRAKAVANILVKNGISLERIAVIGYGDIRPAASNATGEGRVKNRRVEVKLVPDNREF